MKINITLEKDDLHKSFIMLNAVNMYIGITDLIDSIRSMLKYGIDKNKTIEEILQEIKEELENLILIDTRDDNLI